MECNEKSWAFMPAAAFEIINKIDGISGDYLFPNVTLRVDTGPDDDKASLFHYHLCDDFSQAVFSCYRNPVQSNFKIEKISEVDPQLMIRMQEDWNRLVDLNPELDKVQFDKNNPLGLLDALLGASCLINADDINFFVNLRMETGRWDIENVLNERWPDRKILSEEVANMSPVRMQWIPSSNTLALMKEKLSVKQAALSPLINYNAPGV